MARAQLAFELDTPDPACWCGTLGELHTIDADAWLAIMQQHHQVLTRQRASGQQLGAWRNSLDVLRATCAALFAQRPASRAWTIIFEYELPREGGRRPDAILLADGQIVVVEFKEKAGVHAADIDQVAAYARDLAHYHEASHDRGVWPVLVPTRSMQLAEQRNGVHILAPDQLAAFWLDLPAATPIDADRWLRSPYAPLPSIVEAARQIFAHEPLPFIRRAHSAGIPHLLAYLEAVTHRAQTDRARHLVLITGVPGAGKTLVGLQFVYQNRAADNDQAQAIMLSGNAPLVAVLQYALRSRVFVQPIRNFFMQYGVRRKGVPPEHIIVFDEAQRAWDLERMGEKYGVEVNGPRLITSIAEQVPDWAITLGLIGEGQEIHLGEEGGIDQWNAALAASEVPWHVHCAPELAPIFPAAASITSQPFLNLSTSLRSHLAQDVQAWVAALLAGDIPRASVLAPQIAAYGFNIYLTRDWTTGARYCRERYADHTDKRYGLLASSKGSNLPRYGVPNDFQTTKRLKVGPWYIDPPNSPDSCCAFNMVATEFACQGLELDLPVVCWGSDLVWDATTWRSKASPSSKAKDPHRLRINSYRVLLTRGRDGMIIFVPPETRMNTTYDVLLAAGAVPLDIADETE